MNIQIGDYEIDSFILDLGLEVSIITRKTWKNMGSLKLAWSLVRLRLDNQARVTPIGQVMHLAIEVKGMKTYVDFDFIEVVEGGSSYPRLMGIGWANDSMAAIIFKKRVMTLENHGFKVIISMDPTEG